MKGFDCKKQTCTSTSPVQEIKEWTQEQVELLEDHQWNDEEERAPMADRRHALRWNEAEQLQMWEFDEGETI